jgi:hypothetical protein
MALNIYWYYTWGLFPLISDKFALPIDNSTTIEKFDNGSSLTSILTSIGGDLTSSTLGNLKTLSYSKYIKY